MSNRVDRKDGYCELLLMKNERQNLTDKYYAKVSAEDYTKIKKYDWRIYKSGGKLVAATFIGRDFTTINKLLFPDLKRLHRYNDDSLDYRRFNIKHFRKETEEKTQKQLKVEENKLVSVSSSTYKLLEKFKKDHDFDDQDTAITHLLNNSGSSLWSRIKGAVKL